MPMTSPLDSWASVAAALSSGNPLALAGMFARPALRSAILSNPYQKLMASPSGKIDLAKLMQAQKQSAIPALLGSSTTQR